MNTTTHYRQDQHGKPIGLDWNAHGGIANPPDEVTPTVIRTGKKKGRQ